MNDGRGAATAKAVQGKGNQQAADSTLFLDSEGCGKRPYLAGIMEIRMDPSVFFR